MKIGQPADKPVTPTASPLAAPGAMDAKATATAAAAAAFAAAATPARAAEETSAQLKLSNTAATLLSASGGAEFDAAKVARISNAIDKGEFKINPEAIADKLIANAQELLTQAKN